MPRDGTSRPVNEFPARFRFSRSLRPMRVASLRSPERPRFSRMIAVTLPAKLTWTPWKEEGGWEEVHVAVTFPEGSSRMPFRNSRRDRTSSGDCERATSKRERMRMTRGRVFMAIYSATAIALLGFFSYKKK